MATLSLVKSLTRSTPTMVDKLTQFVFGDTVIDLYDPTKSYDIGDYIYMIDEDGTITFYECIEPTTGEFDPSKWKVVSVIGMMKTLIQISEVKPNDPNVVMWHKPVSYEYGDVDAIIPEMNPDKLTFTIENGFATITGLTDLKPGEFQHFYGPISAPKQINGHIVTSIANNAFSDVTGITDLVIPDNILDIGEGAFMPATDSLLASVTIGYGVSTLKYKVFANQTALTSVDIPATVDNIEISAFDGCTAITDVTIRGRHAIIADDAFLNCTSLTNIHGYNNSTAQEFAIKNGYTFIEL